MTSKRDGTEEIKQWYTAGELAGLPGLPGTERAVQLRAKREGWKSRPRQGRGGGLEYHRDCLPESARLALIQNAGPFCLLPAAPAVDAGAESGRRLAEEKAARAERMREQKGQNVAAFHRLPEHRQQEAYAKLELLDARDAFIKVARLPLKRGSEIFAVEYQAGRISLSDWVKDYARRSGRLSVSWRSLFRWRRDYEERGLIGLVNGYKDTQEQTPADPERPWLSWDSTVPGHMREYIVGLITALPTIKDKRIFDALKAHYAGERQPGDAAVRRFVARFKRENEALLLYLANPDAWRNLQMLALGSASEQIHALNQLWEMDSTPTDVMLKDGRHTIIGCLDVFSRRVKLLVSPTSKATAVAALIRRCLLAWGCPPPTRAEKNPHEGIKTDNGADYTARHIDVVLDALQIHQPLCTPFSPEQKPHIERFFRTFSHGLVELMPGFIGHNVAERKAIEARRTFAARLMKHGEEPIKVELTGDEFQALCDRWVEAIYHQDVHGELGMSPADKARSWNGEVRRIENERALDMLLMPGACTRRLSKSGIRHDRGTYIAAEFGLLEVGEELRIYPDATDLGTIYVYRLEGDFLCIAQDPERTGIDRAEVAARAKAIQKGIMQEGARRLRKIAKQTGAEQAFEEILRHRESLIANVSELPRRAENYTTAALEQAGIAAEARQQQVVEPEQRRAERAALVAEMAETGKLVPLQLDARDRWRLCTELQRRIAAGETVSDRDRDWLVTYMRSSDYRIFTEVEADLAIGK